MFKLDRANKLMKRLPETSLSAQGILEVQDLEMMVINSFQEIAESLGMKGALVLGRQIHVADEVLDRLDILAIEPSGAIVVIELKRSYDDNQLYQGLGYAAMLSEWSEEDFVATYAEKKGIPSSEARDEVEEFLSGSRGKMNYTQRVVVIAEEFDLKTLTTAKWLREKYEIDVTCVQLDIVEMGAELIVGASTIVPTPGLSEMARITRRRGGVVRQETWEANIQQSQNPQIAAFFQAELAANVEHNGSYLEYRVNQIRRISIGLNKKSAYVWQHGRFTDDLVYWRQLLGPGVEVAGKNGGKALAFSLSTVQNLQAVKNAVLTTLPGKTFVKALPD